ncbi:MAG: hypothetical protein QW835_00645 [Candidatus Hadarchaeum sp.]
MMALTTPEKLEIEVREGFRLALPKFLWEVLEARAKILYQGDLKKTVLSTFARSPPTATD